MTNVLNMLVFQCVWFACVLGAAGGSWWFGPVCTLPLIAMYWHAMRARGESRIALVFLAVLACVGVITESIMVQSGVYRFQEQSFGLGLVWMVALWVGFATTLPLSLRWLVCRPMLAAVSGLVFAPLSFLAGEKLAAIEILEPRWRSLAALGVAWAIVIPLAGQAVRRRFSPIENGSVQESAGESV